MARRIKPYQQGALDGLCGMHAIINALYFLFPGMSKKQAQKLFKKLTNEIARQGAIKAVWRGVDAQMLRQLLSIAIDRVAREHSATIKVTRPFASKSVELPDLVQRLRAKIDEDCVAITLVREDIWHWTVIRKVTGKTILLFDSAGLGAIRIDNCELEESAKRYRINAGHMMLLRRLGNEKL